MVALKAIIVRNRAGRSRTGYREFTGQIKIWFTLMWLSCAACTVRVR
ncbi:MAG: hypothetical protein U5L72_10240 [Bacteroidales bacterium]|nr:hypothetical protein [Bacteroidales bacterium]